jgi:hypothetical protein
MNGFAVIVPIGPGTAELRRFNDLLDSLWTYEPGARLCIAIRSSPCRGRAELRHLGKCRFVNLHVPWRDQGEPLLGRLSASLLLGYRLIHSAGPFEFVLRLDTDALVIAPFRRSVRRFLDSHPETGMLGTLGHTCRRESPYYGCEKTTISDVFTALENSPSSVRIRQHACLAVEHGYAGKEYCQGGAYVLPFRTLNRMRAAGCLDCPEDWLPLAVPEDVMIGMYTRAVGLRSMDCSLSGQLFGNHFSGLAYSPQELVRRGHSIIHSVKRDPNFSEGLIRRYFRKRRAFVNHRAGRLNAGSPREYS